MESCRLARELVPGERVFVSHTVSEAELALFAAATGDVNPIHFDRAYAGATFFKGRIVHGMLCAGLISSVIGNHLPGLGTIYVSQSLQFLEPVRVGDTLTVAVEVQHVDVARNLVRLRTTCTKGETEVVVDGVAVVEPPKARPTAESQDAIRLRTEALEASMAKAKSAFISALTRDSGPT
ncbi:MAG: MaoC family dehydratase [Deltaproteobacteria bacterium]|nr:MaoC family dehydratase [Deltaproteobacteria bacterium]